MRSRILSRRSFGAAIAAAALPAVGTRKLFSGPGRQAGARPSASFQLQVEPGYLYELTVGPTPRFPVGSHWVGGRLAGRETTAGAAAARPDSGPLWKMYRQRVIWKLDDLADWSFPSWRRFCAVVDQSGARADLGINPGRCSPEVFDWLRSLDSNRFELWNHTWDHGAEGPRQAGLEYDRQYENLDICQKKVREELGITMRAFGPAGIRPYAGADHWIEDGDEVTYYAVRNHPDLTVYFGAEEMADRGRGQINSEGILTVSGPIDLENPDGLNTKPATRDLKKRYPVDTVGRLYPGEDPSRPAGPGNPGELIWRMEHPFGLDRPGDIDRMASIFLQCHPWNWDFEAGLESAAALADYINRSDRWRFGSASETFTWLKDGDRIELEKTATDRFELRAHRLEFTHLLELDFPGEVGATRVPYKGRKLGG